MPGERRLVGRSDTAHTKTLTVVRSFKYRALWSPFLIYCFYFYLKNNTPKNSLLARKQPKFYGHSCFSPTKASNANQNLIMPTNQN